MESKKPSMYCGASQHHIHCENYEFKNDEKLLPFGKDEVDPTTTWLDVKYCSGIVCPDTFTMFSNLDYINFQGCTLEFSPKAFGLITQLKTIDFRKCTVSFNIDMFEDSEHLQSLHICDMKLLDFDFLTHLINLDYLNFENCVFENSRGAIFKTLNSLQYLFIERCEIPEMRNFHEGIENLESLVLIDNKIEELDPTGIFYLKKLNNLSIFNNTSLNIDYNSFKKLPSLETVMFDLNAYKSMDFSAFPKLHTIKIGFLNDFTEEENEIIEKLKSTKINLEYTFCGKVEVDMSQMQICA